MSAANVSVVVKHDKRYQDPECTGHPWIRALQINALKGDRACLEIDREQIDISRQTDAQFAEAALDLKRGERSLTANFIPPESDPFGAYDVYCERLP